MPVVAMIDNTNTVYNKIVADPNMDQFPGFQLVAIPDASLIDFGWTWTAIAGFVAPVPIVVVPSLP